MRKKLRIALIAGSVATLGAAAAIVTSNNAFADLPGLTASPVTAANGGNGVVIAGRPALKTSFASIRDVSWSPDGSRVVYVTQDANGRDELVTSRYGNAADWYFMRMGRANVQLASPTWRGPGTSIAVAAKFSGQPWRIELQDSAGAFQADALPDDSLIPSTGDYINPNGGPDGDVVFEHKVGSTSEVMLYRGSTGQVTTVIGDAAEPALSPTGSTVAFVRGGSVFTVPLAGGAATREGPAGPWSQPTWSPDEQKIAAVDGNGRVFEITLDNGVSTDANMAGVPAYQPWYKNKAVRLAGPDRFTTAVATSRSHWSDGAAGAVVLSRADDFADALGGAPLAADKGGPLLLTSSGALSPATRAELIRVLGARTGRTVYLLGGTAAVSQAIQDDVASLGYAPKRIAGANRFETSVLIAKEISPTPNLVLAATGRNFPDGLAAGAAAGSYNVPGRGTQAVVVLTHDSSLTPEVSSYLNALPATTGIYGIGGYAAAATAAYGRRIAVAGSNRYDTAARVGRALFRPFPFVGVATGTNWPDALAGGALMAQLGGPLLLTDGSAGSLATESTSILSEYSGAIDTGLVFGNAVVDAQLNQMGSWLSGPYGFGRSDNPTGLAQAG